MKLLALCTSGPVASASIVEDGRLAATELGQAGLTHSETLIPLCDALLKSCGISLKDIGLFAADVGPGSFTGVRIGVCAANAFAFAMGKKVVPVSALGALAHGLCTGSVCALLDARNGNGYAACYQDGACTLPPTPVEVQELLKTLPENTMFVGDHALHAGAIRSALPGARLSTRCLLTADLVALSAWQLQAEAVAEARPMYLRPSQAERLFEARHG